MRILVIDDDALVARILARLLRGHDVHVLSASTEALEPIFSRDYDLIFCDLMMPELSGTELYEIVSEHDPGLAERFVFVTGGAYTCASSAFVSASERPILHKPFNRQKVEVVMAELRSSAAHGR